MLQLAKEENIDFLVVSYHELKDETASQMKKILQHCQLDFGDSYQVISMPRRFPGMATTGSKFHLGPFL
jgi:hypothetical protein